MDVSFLDETRFGWARFTGSWSIDDICASVDRLVAECISRKDKLLLIDWSRLETKRVSTLDRYRLATAAQALTQNLDKVATVIPPEMIDTEKFGERAAQNRGLNLRVFSELDAAERWLLSDDG